MLASVRCHRAERLKLWISHLLLQELAMSAAKEPLTVVIWTVGENRKMNAQRNVKKIGKENEVQMASPAIRCRGEPVVSLGPQRLGPRLRGLGMLLE